jgi:predicted GNAT superfamily acetyltransferase
VTRPYVIRDVTHPAEMAALEEVQMAAWGMGEREVVPGTLFRISAATGGVVLAAYPADSAVPFGLAYGFPAQHGPVGRTWHHSHLLAVAPAWRACGAAVALKQAQRQRALAQGHSLMTWTFDPLIARNARLNLGKLGARAVAYLPGWYDLGGTVPADRLLVEWDLTQPRPAHPAPAPQGQVILEADGDWPGPLQPHHGAPRLLAEVPTAPTEAARPVWQAALREALGGVLGSGYVITDLARRGKRAWYVLEPGAGSGLIGP